MSGDVRRSRRWSVAAALAVLGTAGLITAGAGCKKAQKPSGEVIEAKDEGPTVDPELARAMATASAVEGQPAAGDAGDGPPEAGVFGPGEADRQLPRGAPAALTIGGLGSEPRVRLTGRPPVGKSSLRLRLNAQRQGRQEVPIDVDLLLEVAAAKGPAPDPAAAPPATGLAPLTVTAKVAAAKVDSALVPANVSKDHEATVAALKGSRITFELAASGAGTGFAIELAKAADPGLANMLHSFSDLLAVLTVPYPTEPVGVGGMWMATTREAVLGIDTVSYRLVKVRSVQGDRVSLEVNSRRFAAEATQTIPGLTAEGAVELQQFKSEGTGVVDLNVAAGFPDTGRIQYDFVVLALTGDPPKPMVVQERVQFVLGSPVTGSPVGPVAE